MEFGTWRAGRPPWQHAALMNISAPLRAQRDALHACPDRRGGALFEMVSALLAAALVPSLPHLSLAPLRRRGWGSVDAALAEGHVEVRGPGAAVTARP